MAEANVEVFKSTIRAFNERGVDGVLEYFDEEVEVYDPDLPEGTPVRGRDAVREVIDKLTSGFDSMQVQDFEFHTAGDRVVGLIHTVGEGEGALGGVRMEMRDAHTMTFRDGKVVYWRLYLDRREALADAGLDPSLAEAPGPERGHALP